MTVSSIKHKVKFVRSMVDEKKSRKDNGPKASGSSYLFHLCDATHLTAKGNLDKFTINCKLNETIAIAETLHTNPDKLSKCQLDQLAKEVQAAPCFILLSMRSKYWILLMLT